MPPYLSVSVDADSGRREAACHNRSGGDHPCQPATPPLSTTDRELRAILSYGVTVDLVNWKRHASSPWAIVMGRSKLTG
jgi:hypothetical protein